MNMPEKESFNAYCDESCHLEHDCIPVMLFGCISCPTNEARRLSLGIRNAKRKHTANGELKWTKVSLAKLAFYHELVDWFFSEPSICFRCLVVAGKSRLNHDYFNQGSHDTFYYKMYFYLLRQILRPGAVHSIYLDIKDTRSHRKIKELRRILCNDIYDFTGKMINRIQQVPSRQSNLIQMGDFLMGAVAYKQRGLSGNAAKLSIVNRICDRTGLSLLSSTPPWVRKFNLFVFQPAGVE